MAKLDLNAVLTYKGAYDLTGFQTGKFKEPQVKADLTAAGAENLDEKPSRWRIPTQALISAGLLTKDGESTKRLYLRGGGDPVSGQGFDRLGLFDVEKLQDEKAQQLVAAKQELDDAEHEVAEISATIESGKAQLVEANKRHKVAATSAERLERAVQVLAKRKVALEERVANDIEREEQELADRQKALEARRAELASSKASKK
jgi:hypothetical protein